MKRTRIMYVELKPATGHHNGPACIERVRFSESGKLLYCRDRVLEKLGKEGLGKSNYADMKSGERYWVSGPKKRGDDRLHPGMITIADDVREEYWTTIRNQPDKKDQKTIRCKGKRNQK